MKRIAKIDNRFYIEEEKQYIDELPAEVYNLKYDAHKDFHWLERTAPNFSFPYKVYDVDTPFVDRVEKAFISGQSNLGILLNGPQGTGKTVTAKQICNRLSLPVVLVTEVTHNMVNFLSSLPSHVLFVDEYEKVFNKHQTTLLSLMDGALSGSKTCFVFTTNNLHVDQNLLSRPSRIRYLKTYEDLSVETIELIVNDLLQYPEFKDDCMKVFMRLADVTIDLVKSIINEVNIFGESPYSFKDIFNLDECVKYYNIYNADTNELIKANIEISVDLSKPSKAIGYDLYIVDSYADIIHNVAPNTYIVLYKGEHHTWRFESHFFPNSTFYASGYTNAVINNVKQNQSDE